MYTDYYEACEAIISRQDAVRELELHQANASDFFTNVGDKEEYEGREVLHWLGY